jgi:CRP-like cAMP-binding protein
MPLFAGLDEPVLRLLAERFDSEQIPERRTVFEQGDPPDRLYVIAHGSVEVVRQGVDGAVQHLAILNDGDVFGEMGLLNNAPRNATIRTLAPSLLLTLSSDQFGKLSQLIPQFRQSIQTIASDRTHDASRPVAS